MDLPPNNLISESLLEQKPSFVTNLEEAGRLVKQLTNGVGETEFSNALQSHTTREKDDKRVQLGLLHMALTEPGKQRQAVFSISLIARDNLVFVVGELTRIVVELWPRLEHPARENFIQILVELISMNVTNVEYVMIQCLKRMTCGDLSASNLWLISAILEIMERHREWLEGLESGQHPQLLPVVVFSFVRLLPDHYNTQGLPPDVQQKVDRLRNREAYLVVTLFKKHFDQCIVLGRDLIRLFSDASKVPDIAELWKTMIQNPTSISPKFTSLMVLLDHVTIPVYNGTLIPHELEAWTKWFFRSVHATSGSTVARYLSMLSNRFFPHKERQSLRVCYIRYIVTVFFPDNEMLASSLITRWWVITWLIDQSTTATSSASCKLALLFDWLFYRKTDVIMVIEPAILAMKNNIARNAACVFTLIDFLIKAVQQYYPPLTEEMTRCVRVGLQDMLSKNVIRCTSVIFDGIRNNADLTQGLRDLFGDLAAPIQPPSAAPNPVAPRSASPAMGRLAQGATSSLPRPAPARGGSERGDVGRVPVIPAPVIIPAVLAVNDHDENTEPPILSNGPMVARRSSTQIALAQFSDDDEDDDDIPSNPSKIDELRRAFVEYRLRFKYNVETVDVRPLIPQLEPALRKSIEVLEKSLRRGTGQQMMEDACEAMEGVVTAVLNSDALEDLEMAGRTAQVLCQLCRSQFSVLLFPKQTDPESLEDSISAPVFVLFRNVCQMSADDNKRELLLLLLAEMQRYQPRMGYFFLYFLKVGRIKDDSLSAYRNFCNSQEQPNFIKSLYNDLQLLADDDRRLFVYLLPEVFTAFAEEIRGDPKFVYMVISSVDGAQMNEIVSEIMQEHLEMVDKNTVHKLLDESLEWETIQQYFFWQIINAHEIPTDRFIPVIPKLDHRRHHEAMSNLLLMLKLERPTEELVRIVLTRPITLTDTFSLSILHFWGWQHTSRLADILSALLLAPSKDRKKMRKEANNQPQGPSLVQILGHLDFMREKCRNIEFLQQSTIQTSLQQVQNTAPDDIKAKFSELLALAEESQDDVSKPLGRNLRNLTSRRAAQAERRQSEVRSTTKRNHRDSTSEDSVDEDEEELLTKKKRKKALRLDDSD